MDKIKIERSQECINTIKELRGIIAGFAEVSGLALTFDDLTDQSQGPSVNPGMSDFCRMLKDTPNGMECCKSNYSRHLRDMVSTRNTIEYDCHAGLLKFSIPVMFRHSPVAAICGGQFRPLDFNEATLEKLANRFSLDKTKFYAAFNNLKVKTKEDLSKIISTLDNLAQKIIRSAERQQVIEEAVEIKWLLESYDSDPNEMLMQICNRCKKLVGDADHGCILRIDPYSGNITSLVSCEDTECQREKAEGLILFAITKKEAILVKDAQTDTRCNNENGLTKERSNIVIPIFHKKDVIGVISLSSLQPNSFDESDKELIRLLAPQVGMAIKTSEQIHTLKKLYDVGLSMTSSLDLSAVLRNIVDHLKDLLNADIVKLYPYEKEKTAFVHPPIFKGDIYNNKYLYFSAPSDRIVKKMSQFKTSQFVNNVDNDNVLGNKFTEDEGIKSSAVVPLRIENDITGVLFVNFRRKHCFTEEDRCLIEMFGSLSAVAINRVQLQKRMTWEERLAAMGKTSAEIAHRVSNPLGVIFSTIENLKHNKSNISKEKLDRKLNKIIENVDRINVIKDRMLKPLRLIKKLERININREISSVIQSLKDEGRLTDNIKVSFCPDDLLELILDSDDIREVFLSLMNNAINAMPDGGSLQIETYYSEKGQKIEIIIEDTGCGIPSDKLGNIFEPFETTTAYGTGLGLSIANGIIKSYGGGISVKSEEGKGTRFIVTLPLNEKTRGTEALGFAVRFFNELLEAPSEIEKIKEMRGKFNSILYEAYKSISLVTKDFQVELIDNFKIARKIFHKRGKGVNIVGGRMVIGSDYVVNYNYEIVDEIKDKLPGSNATISQIIGDQAVRISTNVQNADGTMAINTVVSRPVYQQVVINKDSFIGLAWVLNERYVIRYEPIFDVMGDVIGILHIGISEMHPQIIEKLENEMSPLKFCDGGYVFIINEKGETIYHPYLPSAFDFSNKEFYQNEMQSKKGWMDATYESENGLRQEIIHYHHFPEWNWIICAACPREEVLSFLKGEKYE